MIPFLRKFVHGVLVSVCVLLAGMEIALWNRSHSRGDVLHWVSWHQRGDATAVHFRGIDVGVGCVQYLSEWSVYSNDPRAVNGMTSAAAQFQRGGRAYRSTRPIRNLIRDNGDSMAAALGFEYRNFDPDGLRAGRREIVFPFWFIILLTLAYPVGSYVRRVLRRSNADRQTQNLCPRCGEPLVAHASHCPLCDRPIVTSTA